MITVSPDIMNSSDMKKIVYTIYEYIEAGMPEDKEKFIKKKKLNTDEKRLVISVIGNVPNRGYLMNTLLSMIYLDFGVKVCVEEKKDLTPFLVSSRSNVSDLAFQFIIDKYKLGEIKLKHKTPAEIKRYTDSINNIFNKIKESDFSEIKQSGSIDKTLKWYNLNNPDLKIQRLFVIKLLEDVGTDAELAKRRIDEAQLAFNELNSISSYNFFNSTITERVDDMTKSGRISKETRSVILSLYRFYTGDNKGQRIRSYSEALKRSNKSGNS